MREEDQVLALSQIENIWSRNLEPMYGLENEWGIGFKNP